MKKEISFPHVRKSVEQFLNDEEGNISRNKLLSIGSMMIVLGVLMADTVYAAHRSHSSHSSHSSGSGSSASTGYHSSHVSHQSHISSSTGTSTGSHQSHSSSVGGSTGNTTVSNPVATQVQNIVEGWKLDNIGWWWQNADGSYPVSTWRWLDGNHDGIYESYCFDPRGYIYQNTTTPDGYTVNADGAWVSNGIVMTKTASQMVTGN